MDYVQGQNLAELVRNVPIAPNHAARYLKLVAGAIHYAHEQGVLHRDLKPSNILVDSATDQPRITDFGLAKHLDSDTSLTRTGQLLGSPNFMPPEQASSTYGRPGRPSDVYALGGILFYVLTARAPFQGETIESTIHQVLTMDVLSPRLLNTAVPRDLETICLKCLEKNPSHRYASAQEVADELNRFIQNEPIQARPISPTERAWRWCRRKPTLAAAYSFLLLLLLIIVIGSPLSIYRINKARRQAEANLYAADMALAGQSLENHDLRGTRALLKKHQPLKRAPGNGKSLLDPRGWEWRYFYGQCQGNEIITLASLEAPISTVCFSRDGQFAAAAVDDGTVHIWDVATHQEKAKFQTLTGKLVPVAYSRNQFIEFSPNGKWLAAAGLDRQITIWDLSSGKRLMAWVGNTNALQEIAFSPDGNTLASASSDGTLRLWDLQRDPPSLLNNLSPGSAGDGLYSVAWAPSGQLLAAGSAFGRVTLWNTSNLKAPRDLWHTDDDWMVYSVTFSPDGKTLALIGNQTESAVRRFNLETLQELPPLRGHKCIMGQIACSPDGTQLADAGNDWNISVWDLSGNAERRTLAGHLGDVMSIAFSPDSKTLISGSFDKTVRLWDVSGTPALVAPIGKHPMDVPFSADSRYVASVDGLGHLALWDVARGRQLAATNFESDLNANAEFSARSKALFVHSAHKTRKLEIPSLHLLAEYPHHKRRFAPDETFSIYVAENRRVIRQETSTGVERVLGTLPHENDAFDLSTDGSLAACAMEDSGSYGVMLLDTTGATKPVILKGHPAQVWCLAFSPDNALLATGSWDGSIGLWDIPKHRNIAFLQGHTGYIWRVAFAPDGLTLASCADDTSIKFWNIRSLQEAGTLHPNRAQVTAIAFSPDGRHLASGGGGELKLWHAPTFEEIAQKEERQQ